MKFIDKCFLSGTIKIDHDIPAEDQIERVFDGEIVVRQVESPKTDHGGQVRFDLKATRTVAAPTKEMPSQHTWRDVSNSVFVVDTRCCPCQNTCRQVGCQNLEIPFLWALNALEERDRNRIGFFSGRTGGRPYPNPFLQNQLGQYHVAEKIKMFGLAEKISFVGRNQIQHPRELFPRRISGHFVVIL